MTRRRTSSRARRNPHDDLAWLDDPDATTQPVADYFDQEGDAPDEATLVRVFQAEQRRDPDFRFVRKTLRNGDVLYTSGDARRRYEPTTHVYERDAKGGWSREDAGDFIFRVDPEGYYPDHGDVAFARAFWTSPSPLYHGTPSLRSVLKTGLKVASETRGLTNRGVGAAVFTSIEPDGLESYAQGSDGGIVVIDTARMARDGLTPDMSQEPEALEHELRGALAHALEIDYRPESIDPSGADPNTVIVYGSIPAKYVKRYGR